MHQVKLAAAIAFLIATGCQPQSEPIAQTRTTTPLMLPPEYPPGSFEYQLRQDLVRQYLLGPPLGTPAVDVYIHSR
jgi:hypothetical protein